MQCMMGYHFGLGSALPIVLASQPLGIQFAWRTKQPFKFRIDEVQGPRLKNPFCLIKTRLLFIQVYIYFVRIICLVFIPSVTDFCTILRDSPVNLLQIKCRLLSNLFSDATDLGYDQFVSLCFDYTAFNPIAQSCFHYESSIHHTKGHCSLTSFQNYT